MDIKATQHHPSFNQAVKTALKTNDKKSNRTKATIEKGESLVLSSHAQLVQQLILSFSETEYHDSEKTSRVKHAITNDSYSINHKVLAHKMAL